MIQLPPAAAQNLAAHGLEVFLEARARDVASGLGWPDSCNWRPMPAKDPRSFDFQFNGAFAAAKALCVDPKAAAAAFAEAFSARFPELGSADAAGTAFVNFRLADAFLLERALDPASPWPDLSGASAIVDYSSPNCAKQMHVGHLRSTVIGDAIVGVLSASSVKTVPVNHLGDFGTPFGVILVQCADDALDPASMDLESIEAAYKRGSARFKSDDAFADRARAATAKIQSAQEPESSAYRALLASSSASIRQAYLDLGVGLRDEHIRGESFYAPVLQPVLDELLAKGVVRVDRGAAVFTREGRPPLLLAKSPEQGGGFLYGATDAAALRQRASEGFDNIVYVVDSRQSDHFESVFAIGQAAGWLRPGQACIHAKFGMMLSPDGGPFKTRSGDAMLLRELIAEARSVARSANAGRVGDDPAFDFDAFVDRLGVDALKYADISRPREGDVKFNLESICSLDGNTSAFVQYAASRAASIVRKAAGVPASEPDAPLEPAERRLALELARLPSACAAAAALLAPHAATDALFKIAQAFGSFYEACPALSGDASDRVADARRLALCSKAFESFASVLSPLGIRPLDSMPRRRAPAP